ncbi:MAG: SMP-30/gluconolactonase/LRE family protein [Myxococcota bacterium]|nr:hypothetical protein [Myxococcota bacterium]
MNRLVATALLAIGLAACAKNKNQPPVASASEAASEGTTAAAGEAGAAAVAAEPTPPPPPPAPEPVVAYKDMSVPESVLYDEKEDCYLVSNINGEPGAKDNNGFISKLGPDGAVIAMKWIEGGKGKLKLDAPKGMGIVADTLYVADIDTVRMFNRKTGAAKGEIKVKGSTFLGDITTSPDGRVFVSDIAITFADGKATPTGTDAVYLINKAKKVIPLSKSTDLGGPNGLVVVDNKLWVVSMLSGELYSLDAAKPGARGDTQKLPKGGLDGIVSTPNGIMISSWELGGVMKGTLGGEFTPVLEQIAASADIGFDSKRNRILVPRFMNNSVEVYSVQ